MSANGESHAAQVARSIHFDPASYCASAGVQFANLEAAALHYVVRGNSGT
ncbi:hypothetical protein [Lysobacter sp. A3-1-A15]